METSKERRLRIPIYLSAETTHILSAAREYARRTSILYFHAGPLFFGLINEENLKPLLKKFIDLGSIRGPELEYLLSTPSDKCPRFDDLDRKILLDAASEACADGAKNILPIHLLISVIKNPDCGAARLLDSHGLTLDKLNQLRKASKEFELAQVV